MNAALPLVLLSVLLNTTAQIMLKETMNRIGDFTFSWHNLLPISFQVLLHPFFIFGMTCYIFSLFVWLLVLSRIEVSIAYPLTSLGYIFSAIAAYYLLGENLTLSRILGILVIIAGVYLLCRS